MKETISFPWSFDADDVDLVRKEWKLAGLDTDLDESDGGYTVLVVGKKKLESGKFEWWEWQHSYYRAEPHMGEYRLIHSSLTALEFSEFHDD